MSLDRTTAGRLGERHEHATPLVELIEAKRAPLLARRYYEDGDPGPIVRALAHVPELLEVMLPFIGLTLGPSAIGVRTKELVILRTSAVAQCRYCVQTHTAVAIDVGLTVREIRALRGDEPIDGAFDDPSERALLAWVDVVAARGAIDRCVADELRVHFPDADVVELTVLVGATLMLNRVCTALELPTSDVSLARLADGGFA